MLQLTDAQVEILHDALNSLEGFLMDGWPSATLDEHETALKAELANHLTAQKFIASFDPQI